MYYDQASPDRLAGYFQEQFWEEQLNRTIRKQAFTSVVSLQTHVQ